MGIKPITTNKIARHKYAISDKYEAGLVLVGTEVKALREGSVQLRDSWVENRNGELWLKNVHIGSYQPSGRQGHDAMRSRKLLLKADEIKKIVGKIDQAGFVLVPLRMYFKDGWAKVEVGLGKGMKKHDRRQDIKARDEKRTIERDVKAARIKT